MSASHCGPLRILLTTWQYTPKGSVRSVEYLAQGLHARGHDVRVVTPADGVLGRRLLEAGVPVVDHRFGHGWSLTSARLLFRLARDHRVDLVDAQEARDRKAAILARTVFRMPARLIISRRQETSSFFLQNRLYAAVADRIVAISEGVARSLASRGTPRDRIVVVHTGLDPKALGAAPTPGEVAALRKELGLEPTLATVGVVSRRKDQETLLRALPRLGRPLNVVFAGIERDDRLAALEPGLPEGTRVVYTGFIPVRPVLALLDVKVLTTRREGLSQALLEAMSVGTPVITGAAGGTPELVGHEEHGLLYPPGDDAALARQLARMLDDAPLRRRLVEAARQRVAAHFTADAFVSRTEAVYRQVLKETRR